MAGDAPPSIFDTLFDRAAGVADVVGGLAEDFGLLQRCSHPECGERAIPVRCVVCSRTVCMAHGFFNLRGAAVCVSCFNHLLEVCHDATFGGTQADPEPADPVRPRRPRRQRTPPPPPPKVDPNWPWSVLGLRPGATEAEVNKAFRKIALECHPDRVLPEQAEQARARWAAVSKAKEAAIKLVKSRARRKR